MPKDYGIVISLFAILSTCDDRLVSVHLIEMGGPRKVFASYIYIYIYIYICIYIYTLHAKKLTQAFYTIRVYMLHASHAFT